MFDERLDETLMWVNEPTLTNDQLKHILLNTSATVFKYFSVFSRACLKATMLHTHTHTQQRCDITAFDPSGQWITWEHGLLFEVPAELLMKCLVTELKK